MGVQGNWGSGLIWPFRGLVIDAGNNGTLHMYYSGTEGLHGDMYSTEPAELLASGQRAASTAFRRSSSARASRITSWGRTSPFSVNSTDTCDSTVNTWLVDAF